MAEMMNGVAGTERFVAARESKVFTPKELERLRALVACLGCRAVPRDTGRKRVNRFTGEMTDLPLIVTDHAVLCPVAAVPEGKHIRPPKKGPGWRQRYIPGPPCEQCGAKMDVPARQELRAPKNNTKRYCSTACRNKASKARRKEKRRAARPLVVPKCRFCGGDCTPTSSGRREYCSDSCRQKAARRRKGAPVLEERTFTCEGCGTEVTAVVRRDQRFCTPSCRNAAAARRAYARATKKLEAGR